ncbi:MAG: D-tyrosyl-tRNA(Tyr) deacylase [Bacilli bacterium]|nr:D-tyrosyl-tRNA(Tyr) deacylase [Bacilli bacterium]
MRVTVQRVLEASCVVDNKVVSKISKGFMLLIGFTHEDTIENVKKMCKKIANMRIFEDINEKMNLSIKDVSGEILAISQFTLYADSSQGNRPSFINSMKSELANSLYLEMIKILNEEYQIPTKGGVFGAHMYLHPVCDGPVTINLEF